MEFTELKACLSTWYERKDPLAARKFVEQFLQPAVRREGQRCRLPEDQIRDLQQTIAEFFLFGHPRLAHEAESVQYWLRPIRQRTIDFLRKRGRLAKRELGAEALPESLEADASETAAADAAWVERVTATAAVRQAERLAAALNRLPATRRRAFVLYHHRALQPHLTAADYAFFQACSGWPRSQIDAFLAKRTSEDPNELLPLMFSAEAIASARETCLDTFRRNRSRAAADLKQALGGEAT